MIPGGLIVTHELGENGRVEGGPLWVEVEVCGSKLHWVNDKILLMVPPIVEFPIPRRGAITISPSWHNRTSETFEHHARHLCNESTQPASRQVLAECHHSDLVPPIALANLHT